MIDQLQLEFIHRHINEGLKKIYQAQRNIASRRIYQHGRDKRTVQEKGPTVKGRSGALMSSLVHPDKRVWKGELGNHAVFNYPIYIRFLDMKDFGNYKIYNRQIWGILYNDTFNNIRYGFTQEAREYIRNILIDAMNPLNNQLK